VEVTCCPAELLELATELAAELELELAWVAKPQVARVFQAPFS